MRFFWKWFWRVRRGLIRFENFDGYEQDILLKKYRSIQIAQNQIDIIRVMGYNKKIWQIFIIVWNRSVFVQGGGLILDGYIQIKEAKKDGKLVKDE